MFDSLPSATPGGPPTVSPAKRESWKSRLGFTLAALGSAVGLVNIWRFPYIVGEHGGGAFVVLYIVFLLIIGFPVLLSEVLLGRASQRGPAGALQHFVERPVVRKGWFGAGMGIIINGLLISSFYSVVAGWVLGYFIMAVSGQLADLGSLAAAQSLFDVRVNSPVWCLSFHLAFMILSVVVLGRGVRRGLELANKWLMPLLIVLLLVLVVQGLSLPGSGEAVRFLFRPDWKALTPIAALTALGHAFFTLSLGQGTMITYGSYLSRSHNIANTCTPVVVLDTVVSLLAGIAIITVVFAVGASPAGGEGLLFATLPAAFAKIPGGEVLSALFFLLVVMAALTSQTSAMEPLISHLTNTRGWNRNTAALSVGALAFIIGVPSALSFSLLKDATIGGATFFTCISFLAVDVLVPLAGLLVVLYVGWIWGFRRAFPTLFPAPEQAGRHRTLRLYLGPTVRFLAPLLILLIFLANLGIL